MIDPRHFGVSFSLKQCRNFNLQQTDALRWLLDDAGFRRFRLMSYWDEHELSPGNYDFTALDTQINLIAQAGGVVTLCLGARQPRWPENHWPAWAWELSPHERTEALLLYIAAVVRRYQHRTCIISYQLENEALLKSFGTHPEIDRQRLVHEFALVKQLDPSRPIIMSTSTSWGIPFRAPIPDIVGFSFYHIYFNGRRHRYERAGGHYAYLHRLRARLIWHMWHRPSFIHELQLEPWSPKAIWEVDPNEQDKSMGPEQIRRSLRLGKSTMLYPIDLWGGEWWYWRLMHDHDPSVWQVVKESLIR